MTDHELNHDPVLNPDEQAALAALLAAPELSDAEWTSLHARVAQAAELSLARRRRTAQPQPTGGAKWLRPALPLAAAAVLLLVLTPLVLRNGEAPPPSAAAELGTTERALLADVSDEEFRQLVSGAADAEALLLLAAGEE